MSSLDLHLSNGRWSANGTFETCRQTLSMSVNEARPEVADRLSARLHLTRFGLGHSRTSARNSDIYHSNFPELWGAS